jgi:hypothetical protein
MGRTGNRGAIPHGFDSDYVPMPRLMDGSPATVNDLLDVLAAATNRRLSVGATEPSKGPTGFTRTVLFTNGEPEVIANGFSFVCFSDSHPSYPGQTWFNHQQVASLFSRPVARPSIRFTVKPLHFAADLTDSLVKDTTLTPLEISRRVAHESVRRLWSTIQLFTTRPVPSVLFDLDDRLVTPLNTYVSASRARARDKARGGLSDPIHTKAVFDMAIEAGFQGYCTPLELTGDGMALFEEGRSGAALGSHVKEHLQVCLMSPFGSAVMDLFGRLHVHLDGSYRLTDHRYVVYSVAVSGSAALASFTVATLITSDDSHAAVLRMLKFVFEAVGFTPPHIMADMGKAEIKAIREAGSNWVLCMFHVKQAVVVYFPAAKSKERNTFLHLLNVAQAAPTLEAFGPALSDLNAFVTSSCPPKLQRIWDERYATEDYVRAWASCFRPLMHPLINTDMPLEAIFGVQKNSLGLGKGGRVGDFLMALTTSVVDYEVDKITRFTVQRQRPATSVVSMNVRDGARRLIATNNLIFDGSRFVRMPSMPGDNDAVFFTDKLTTVEVQLEAVRLLLRAGGLPSRTSARSGDEAATALSGLRSSLAKAEATATQVIQALSEVVDKGELAAAAALEFLTELRAERATWRGLELSGAARALGDAHEGVEAALTTAPAMLELLIELVLDVPRIVRWHGGDHEQQGLAADEERVYAYEVDMLTFDCSCPARSLPAALGCLCKHLLAVAQSGLLSEEVFDGLVRIVEAEYYRGISWRKSKQNVWVCTIAGHHVMYVGGNVFSCSCGYMRLALGRYCHFPFCPALAFFMVDGSAGWAAGCLRYSGTTLGRVLETERAKRLLLQPPSPILLPPPGTADGFGDLRRFAAVRDSVGRKPTRTTQMIVK